MRNNNSQEHTENCTPMARKGLWYGSGFVTKATRIEDRPIVPSYPGWAFDRSLKRRMAYVYIFRCEAYLKIGIAKDPAQRRETLEAASPFPITEIFRIRVNANYVRLAERAAHEALFDHHHMREWFLVDVERAIETVTAAVKFAQRQFAADRYYVLNKP